MKQKLTAKAIYELGVIWPKNATFAMVFDFGFDAGSAYFLDSDGDVVGFIPGDWYSDLSDWKIFRPDENPL